MTAPAIITKQMLIDAGACSDQVQTFARLFGDSVNVTVAKARKVASVFAWGFAARFLDDEGRAEYERIEGPAWAEYKRALSEAWAEYMRIAGAAWVERKRVQGEAWAAALAEYECALSEAWAEYRRIAGAALAEYQRIEAAAWAAAYIATCKRKAAK